MKEKGKRIGHAAGKMLGLSFVASANVGLVFLIAWAIPRVDRLLDTPLALIIVGLFLFLYEWVLVGWMAWTVIEILKIKKEREP